MSFPLYIALEYSFFFTRGGMHILPLDNVCFLPIDSGRRVAGVTQEEAHTGFLTQLPSAVHAFIFLVRRIQPFLYLVDREVELCTLTI